MIKLTEDDIELCITDEEELTERSVLIHTENEEKAKQLKQQILDDYEKARKWDNAVINYFPPTEKAIKTLREEYTAAIRNILAINEDQKLTNPLYLDDLRKHFKELTGEEFKAIG